jgi:Fe-S-cluster containining protein
VALPLHIDPDQRFTCASCARCCRRWEILVSPAEVSALQPSNPARWFRTDLEASEGSGGDPFEPIAGWRGYQRIRKRADGACGFLSENDRCRLHEELGERRKPLTCRMFPYQFHAAPGAAIVTTSFGCPTVVANRGERIAAGAEMATIKALRTEWAAQHPPLARPRSLVAGRTMEAGSIAILRQGLRTILNRTDDGVRDLRRNVGRMAAVLDDLTRSRVTGLADADFAEYVRLTVPFAAADTKAIVAPDPLKTFWLLAHLHGLAPRLGRVNVSALGRDRVDVNSPHVQPIAHHYLRASLESLGASERPLLDDLAVTVSYLNAACALAAMNGETGSFGEALMEAVDLTHTDERSLVGRALSHLAGGTEALRVFARG